MRVSQAEQTATQAFEETGNLLDQIADLKERASQAHLLPSFFKACTSACPMKETVFLSFLVAFSRILDDAVKHWSLHLCMPDEENGFHVIPGGCSQGSLMIKPGISRSQRSKSGKGARRGSWGSQQRLFAAGDARKGSGTDASGQSAGTASLGRHTAEPLAQSPRQTKRLAGECSFLIHAWRRLCKEYSILDSTYRLLSLASAESSSTGLENCNKWDIFRASVKLLSFSVLFYYHIAASLLYPTS